MKSRFRIQKSVLFVESRAFAELVENLGSKMVVPEQAHLASPFAKKQSNETVQEEAEPFESAFST